MWQETQQDYKSKIGRERVSRRSRLGTLAKYAANQVKVTASLGGGLPRLKSTTGVEGSYVGINGHATVTVTVPESSLQARGC